MSIRTPLRFAVTGFLTLSLVWASTALYLDFPIPWLRSYLALALFAIVAIILVEVPQRDIRSWLSFGLFVSVLVWWLRLPPSNDRNWLRDVAQTPWAEVQGDKVTIHNVRNFDYLSETDYKVNWETRSMDLSQLRGYDLFMIYWGSEAIAHMILSFQFADSPPIAFSIEARKEVGETYSSLLGFFRQYELVYVVGDERDLVRLRTNYRKGEDVYLYRTRSTPADARAVFLNYIKSANELRAQPQWYNALTTNCTTAILPHLRAGNVQARAMWDWRILLNGYADEMAYEADVLAGGLPFAELKRRAHINEAAKAADKAPDFSQRIRVGRPGFE